ncbi:unnamed protein product [Symbiodinium necroappetens]|uniref:Transmembrane protein n=1 Tax=Symbiodinium necroappetens TaxID=1628268 RepID=A0A812KDY6_9DINO|nr:unnamed protein product [Symbiodinium necroappetens]
MRTYIPTCPTSTDTVVRLQSNCFRRRACSVSGRLAEVQQLLAQGNAKGAERFEASLPGSWTKPEALSSGGDRIESASAYHLDPWPSVLLYCFRVCNQGHTSRHALPARDPSSPAFDPARLQLLARIHRGDLTSASPKAEEECRTKPNRQQTATPESIERSATTALILALVCIPFFFVFCVITVLLCLKPCPQTRIQEKVESCACVGDRGKGSGGFCRFVWSGFLFGLCPTIWFIASGIGFMVYVSEVWRMNCSTLADLQPSLCAEWKQPYGEGWDAAECCSSL